MKFITDQQVEEAILRTPTTISNYLGYLDARIAGIRHKHTTDSWAEVKPKIIYEDPNSRYGDIRPMTCFTDRTKIVKVIATNPHRQRHPSVSVGATVVLDPEENFPVAIIEAPAMSGIRTAAMIHLVLKWTSSTKGRILLVGHGRVGQYVAQMFASRQAPTCLHIRDKKYGEFSDYNGYDAVITATNSMHPFITPENCDAPLVISVGADTYFNHEISPSFIYRKNVFVDIEEAKDVGDLAVAELIAPHVRTMFDLQENGLTDLFISVGSPLMDALTVEFLNDHL